MFEISKVDWGRIKGSKQKPSGYNDKFGVSCSSLFYCSYKDFINVHCFTKYNSKDIVDIEQNQVAFLVCI